MRALRGFVVSRSIGPAIFRFGKTRVFFGGGALALKTPKEGPVTSIGYKGLRRWLDRFQISFGLRNVTHDPARSLRRETRRCDPLRCNHLYRNNRNHRGSIRPISCPTRATMFATPLCHAAALLSFTSSRARFGPYSGRIGSRFFDVRMKARPNLGTMNERDLACSRIPGRATRWSAPA